MGLFFMSSFDLFCQVAGGAIIAREIHRTSKQIEGGMQMAIKDIEETILAGSTRLVTLNTRISQEACEALDQIRSILQSDYPYTTISKQLACTRGLILAARIMREELEQVKPKEPQEIKTPPRTAQEPSKQKEKEPIPFSVKEYREKHHS